MNMACQENDDSEQISENLHLILTELPSSNSLLGRHSFSREVATFLLGMGMEKYIELFRINNITLDVLFSLTIEDLKNIGMENSDDCEKIVKSLKLGYCNYTKNSDADTVNDQTDEWVMAQNLLTHSKDLNAHLTILLARLKNTNLRDHYLARDCSAKKLLRIVTEKAIQQCQMNLRLIHQLKFGEGLIEKLCSVDGITLPPALKSKLKGRKVIRKKRVALLVIAATGFCALAVFINSHLKS